MSMQLNEKGAWFFLRMREWGLGRVGNFKLGRAPLREFFFLFSWERKPQNGHLSVMQLSFSFPHELEWTKHFLETNLTFIHDSQQAKLLGVWTIMVFSGPANCSFSRFLLCIPSIALEVKAWPEGLCSREGNDFLCLVCNCLEIRLDPMWVFIALGLSSLA